MSPPSRQAKKDDRRLLAEAREVLQVEARAILALAERLDDSFSRAVDLLAGCRGRLVTTGMGKSGIIARKLAATFASTGSPSLFLHPAEAAHGDLGKIVEGDVLLALSHSGETEEIARLLEIIKRLGIKLVALTGEASSTLAQHADVTLDVAVASEACPLGLAPTASTTAALAMGDALAMSLLQRKGFRPEDFAAVHPGGRLGARLRFVEDVMHGGDAIPAVPAGAGLPEVITVMTGGRLGIAVVTGEDRELAGVITDGDLRRILQGHLPAGDPGGDIRSLTAAECMTARPRTITPRSLASEALHVMEAHRITALVVTDPDGTPVGVVHLHDLWRTELV
ncbi:MAG: SIS domain-containing protein [Acidobacteriota bacterium]